MEPSPSSLAVSLLWALPVASVIHDVQCEEAEEVPNDLSILPQVKLASWSREKPGDWYSTFRRGKKVGGQRLT